MSKYEQEDPKRLLNGMEASPEPNATETRVVNCRRGVKINHIWYWSDVFRTDSLDGKPVKIRIEDPWDVAVVYALIKGKWHLCSSKLENPHLVIGEFIAGRGRLKRALNNNCSRRKGA